MFSSAFLIRTTVLLDDLSAAGFAVVTAAAPSSHDAERQVTRRERDPVRDR
jgi:hypothetical protein